MAFTATVQGQPTSASENRYNGGGPTSALRAYRAHHPGARIHIVEYRGRTVWLTGRQFAIWCYIKGKHNYHELTTLARIAKHARCSRATVSRFLHRLDFWRFVDLVVMRGRGGGTFIFRSKRVRLGYGETRLARDMRHSTLAKRIRIVERYWKRIGHLPPSIIRSITGYTGATFHVFTT